MSIAKPFQFSDDGIRFRFGLDGGPVHFDSRLLIAPVPMDAPPAEQVSPVSGHIQDAALRQPDEGADK